MKLENLNLVELSVQEKLETDGGLVFVPFVIFGISVSAKAVAGACVAAFAGGVTIGAAAYLAGR
jgi:hypothetical protein